jgi:DNA-binding response OmpR family regulator
LSYVSPRIITVEDDADLAELTRAIFRMIGFEA